MDGHTVKFRFIPGDRVKTPWGDMGLIDSCCFRRGGVITYWVTLEKGSDNFYGDDLIAWQDPAALPADA